VRYGVPFDNRAIQATASALKNEGCYGTCKRDESDIINHTQTFAVVVVADKRADRDLPFFMGILEWQPMPCAIACVRAGFQYAGIQMGLLCCYGIAFLCFLISILLLLLLLLLFGCVNE
jgi:hypothetical protein